MDCQAINWHFTKKKRYYNLKIVELESTNHVGYIMYLYEQQAESSWYYINKGPIAFWNYKWC